MSDQHGLETVVARLRILGQPDPGASRNRYLPDMTDTSPRHLATERVSVHWVGREP